MRLRRVKSFLGSWPLFPHLDFLPESFGGRFVCLSIIGSVGIHLIALINNNEPWMHMVIGFISTCCVALAYAFSDIID